MTDFRARVTLLALALAALAPASSGAAVRLLEVAEVSSPTSVTAPPRDRHRLFVVERGGGIRIVRDGVLLDRKFFDLGKRVVTKGEQGFFSMAFAPNYAKSRRFYVAYTARLPGDPVGSILRVDEFRRSKGSQDRADPSSRRNVLSIPHPGSNQHHGGQILFGPDGLLYVSTGDGGQAEGPSDPANNSQRLDSLLGKILRINPRETGSAPYRVPRDNPFAGRPGARPEVFTYGLRNPWRFSLDAATGDLLIGDVGQYSWEEVDYVPRSRSAGTNFGWRCREGRAPNPRMDPPCAPGGRYVPPILVFSQAFGRCAVIGGVVIRSLDLPDLFGRYLYGDHCTGRIRSLLARLPDAVDDRPSGVELRHVSAFGEDACGHVYVTTTARRVYRVADDVAPPCAKAKGRGPPHLTVAVSREQPLRAKLDTHTMCDERCGLTLTGALQLEGAPDHVLATADLIAARDKRVTLSLSIPEDAREEAEKALDRGDRVRVALRFVARDTAGNQRVRRAKVRLTG